LVAVSGSHWLQSGTPSLDAFLCGATLGLPAAAVLLVNNFRDLEADLRSGRHTLAARLGPNRSRTTYTAMVLLPFALVVLLAWRGHPGALLALLALPHSLQLTQRLRQDASAASLNALLAATAKVGLILAVLLAVGVFL
jgi:1,4-dihydroxy-2-naphthoate octaprenyltransferase